MLTSWLGRITFRGRVRVGQRAQEGGKPYNNQVKTIHDDQSEIAKGPAGAVRRHPLWRNTRALAKAESKEKARGGRLLLQRLPALLKLSKSPNPKSCDKCSKQTKTDLGDLLKTRNLNSQVLTPRSGLLQWTSFSGLFSGVEQGAIP